MKNRALERAEQAVEAKQRELRSLTAKGLDANLLADEKRANDKAIITAESALATLENERDRMQAIIDAKAKIGGGYATARGSLYSEHIYRPDGSLSFFKDAYLAEFGGDPEARDRIQQNQREAMVDLDIRADITSGGGAVGLIPPAWLAEQFAAYPSSGRPFADSIGSQPLPDYGMTLSVPRLTTTPTAGVQAAEADAVNETDAVTDTVDAPVVTIAGQQDMSRQALERSLPHADAVIFAALQNDHSHKLDLQLLSGSGMSGQHLGVLTSPGLTVPYTSGSPDGKAILKAIANAAQKVESTRLLPAQKVAMHPRRFFDLLSQFDSDSPVVPQGSSTGRAVAVANGGALSLFGDLDAVKDPNIPVSSGSGTNEDVIIVYRADDLLLMESPLRMFRFEQVLSGTLQVRLQIFNYSAFFPNRWTSSVCVISGTGLVTPSF
jgi:HK97 family phage major capsid protein